MTFLQAKKALAKLAKGDYHSLRYELIEVSPGKLKEDCTVYINDFSFHSGPTWEVALLKMKNQVEGVVVDKAQIPKGHPVDECPECEAVTDGVKCEFCRRAGI